MFLGVVAKPIPEKNFNGMVFLERVAREQAYKKRDHNQNFTDDATANGLLKNGDWIQLVDGDDFLLHELKDAIAETYNLDDDIKERLVLRWQGPENSKGKRQAKYIDDDFALVPGPNALAGGGYNLMCRYNGTGSAEVKDGDVEADTRVVDVSCDSTFMKEIMPRVGQAIRAAYHWVPLTEKIYLYLDNAGGHGTNEVVDAYVKLLASPKYNVICVHQRPRSPATNMLDLGVWMALQNVVEKMHFKKRKEVEALAKTVTEAWDKLEEIKLENVWNRWKMVLDLIIEDEGGDAKVESKRGKLYREPSHEAEVLDVDDEEPTEADLIAELDVDVLEADVE